MALGQLRTMGPEGLMRHDWIFDTLSDLHAYASRNGLPALAQKVAETLVVARREIDDLDDPSPPPKDRRGH
jgi:hypothetical protein